MWFLNSILNQTNARGIQMRHSSEEYILGQSVGDRTRAIFTYVEDKKALPLAGRHIFGRMSACMPVCLPDDLRFAPACLPASPSKCRKQQLGDRTDTRTIVSSLDCIHPSIHPSVLPCLATDCYDESSCRYIPYQYRSMYVCM